MDSEALDVVSVTADTRSVVADLPAEPDPDATQVFDRIPVNAHLDEIADEEAYEDDASYWAAVTDDMVADLKEAMPAGADLSKLLGKLGELRELGHKLIAESVATPPAVQVMPGNPEPVTIGLYTDDEGEIFLSVPEIQIQAGLVKITGGRAGAIHNGWRLIYGA